MRAYKLILFVLALVPLASCGEAIQPSTPSNQLNYNQITTGVERPDESDPTRTLYAISNVAGTFEAFCSRDSRTGSEYQGLSPCPKATVVMQYPYLDGHIVRTEGIVLGTFEEYGEQWLVISADKPDFVTFDYTNPIIHAQFTLPGMTCGRTEGNGIRCVPAD